MDQNQPILPPLAAARFRVKKRIGAGGQGVVYLATQVALDRPVALKMMQSAQPEFAKRFRQEAQVAAKLAHPNLVAVLDHEVEGDLSWIAFEYVPGKSLRQLLCEQRMHWSEAAKVCAGVARGLAAVHAIGAVHRDVKPENVLMDGAEPKLTDFGLARWEQGEGNTQSGIILGTPAYMAPEVVQGGRATAASDLYALGAMLYELISGRTLFDADQPIVAFRAHLAALDPALLAELEAPRGVKELISRCVAKDQKDRPESAAALAEELAALATQAAPKAGATQVRSLTPRDTRRHTRNTLVAKSEARPARVAWPVWVAAGAALAVGLGVARVALTPAPPPPPPTVRAASAALEAPRVDLAPLDARADRLGTAIEESAVGMRSWEISLLERVGEDAGAAVPNVEAKRRLAEFATHRQGLEAFMAELARTAAVVEDPGLEQVRARLAGMRFEVWFWESWGARYTIGDAYTPSEKFLTGALPQRKSGGKPLWTDFSRRLGAQLRRAAERPEAFDRRLADALIQVSRACRHLRTRNDVDAFSEADLYPLMDGWIAGTAKLPAPMGPVLGAAVEVLARSGHESADARSVLPVLEPIAARAGAAWPDSAPGWAHLVGRLRATTPDGAPSGDRRPASPATGATPATARPPRSR